MDKLLVSGDVFGVSSLDGKTNGALTLTDLGITDGETSTVLLVQNTFNGDTGANTWEPHRRGATGAVTNIAAI